MRTIINRGKLISGLFLFSRRKYSTCVITACRLINSCKVKKNIHLVHDINLLEKVSPPLPPRLFELDRKKNLFVFASGWIVVIDLDKRAFWKRTKDEDVGIGVEGKIRKTIRDRNTSRKILRGRIVLS